MNLATLENSTGNLNGNTIRKETASSANGLKRLFDSAMGYLLPTGKTTLPIAPVDVPSHLLERGQIATIARPGSQKIVCEIGALWLTQDGCGKDIVLEAGQEFQCDHHDRNTRILAYALTDVQWRIA